MQLHTLHMFFECLLILSSDSPRAARHFFQMSCFKADTVSELQLATLLISSFNLYLDFLFSFLRYAKIATSKRSLSRCYVQIPRDKEVGKSLVFPESHHSIPGGGESTNEAESLALSVEKPLPLFWLQQPFSLWGTAPP